MLGFMRDRNVMLTTHVSLNMLIAAFTLGISVFAYGFEGGVVNTIQAMPKFVEQFGELNPKTGKYVLSPDRLAYLNSLPLITYAFGVVLSSQLSERFGRRFVFLLMNSICATGAAVSYTSTTYGQILAGRMILQIHIGMEAALVPIFMGELVPAAVRGAFVGSFTFSHIFANFISSIITNFTSKQPDHSSWKIPLVCIFIFPALALLMSVFLPESPRWLLRKGQNEKAAEMLSYINGAREGFVVEDQIKLLREALDDSVEQGRWSDMLKGTNKKRTITACIAAASSMLTGMSFAANYGAIFLAQVNVLDPFMITMVKRAVLLLGPITVMACIDRLGRRSTFLFLGTGSAVSLLVMGSLGSIESQTTELKKAIVAMSIVFPFCYIGSFGSIMQIVPSEISHISLRDKTSMVYWIVSDVCNFVATFTLPYLLQAPYANLGAKVGFIYAATSIGFLVWAFLCYHDLAGRSLEEVDEMFEAGVPAWQSKSWVSTSKMARLTAMENSKGGIVMGEKKALDVEEATHVERK
ncbi:hypothetical protein RB595_005896 [Gaeumannomyces hyphopodioides]